MSRRLLIPLLLASAVVFAQTPSSHGSATKTPAKTAKKSNRKKPSAKKVEAPPVVPQPPPPPPTLAQQAPVAPRVTYQNGLLTIDAPNSTLGDVLAQVKRLTNATVDGPQNLSDRIAVRIGPGQPREVLAALLHGSRFDFVVMGSPQQPNGLSRIVLLARQGGTEPQPAAQAVSRPAPPAPQRPVVVANTDGDEDVSDDRDDMPAAQPMDQQQPQLNQPPNDQNVQPNTNPNGPQSNQPKTPEQLYKELQNLEQQRRQQQNPNDQPPPPPQ